MYTTLRNRDGLHKERIVFEEFIELFSQSFANGNQAVEHFHTFTRERIRKQSITLQRPVSTMCVPLHSQNTLGEFSINSLISGGHILKSLMMMMLSLKQSYVVT